MGGLFCQRLFDSSIRGVSTQGCSPVPLVDAPLNSAGGCISTSMVSQSSPTPTLPPLEHGSEVDAFEVIPPNGAPDSIGQMDSQAGRRTTLDCVPFCETSSTAYKPTLIGFSGEGFSAAQNAGMLLRSQRTFVWFVSLWFEIGKRSTAPHQRAFNLFSSCSSVHNTTPVRLVSVR